jgi:hypothetical protein
LEGVTLATRSATGMKEEAKAKRRKNLNMEDTLDACETTHIINIKTEQSVFCNCTNLQTLYVDFSYFLPFTFALTILCISTDFNYFYKVSERRGS